MHSFGSEQWIEKWLTGMLQDLATPHLTSHIHHSHISHPVSHIPYPTSNITSFNMHCYVVLHSCLSQDQQAMQKVGHYSWVEATDTLFIRFTSNVDAVTLLQVGEGLEKRNMHWAHSELTDNTPRIQKKSLQQGPGLRTNTRTCLHSHISYII